MAGTKRPSFLKRQKEQARAARALEKREAKRIKKEAKAAGIEMPDPDIPSEPFDGPPEDPLGRFE
jgi:hypothetical protein